MDTKERILMSFKELSSERGFYGTTVDELASRYGISKRTIYRYFQNKEEIIEAILLQFMGEIDQQIQVLIASPASPVEKVTHFFKLVSEKIRVLDPRVYSDLQKYYPGIWEKVEQFRAENLKKIVDVLVEGSRQGYFKPLNPVVVTNSLLVTIQKVINPIFVLEHNLTLEEAFNSVLNLFLYGLTVDREHNGNNPMESP